MFDFRLARLTVLRLLLAFASLIGAVQFVRWLLIPAIQFCFHPGDAATSAIRRAGIVVV